MKKVFVAILIVTLLVSFAACQKQETAPDGTSVTTTAATTTKGVTTAKQAETTTTTAPAKTEIENPFAEKMVITWLTGIYTSHLYEEGRWDELELEEMFNVDIKLWNIMIDSSNMEQVQMMLAAGDAPDYGFYYTTGRYMVENGLGRTVPLSMIQQYYPSYYKQLVADPIGFLHNRVEDKEDEYYGLTSFTCMAHNTGHVPMFRLDWLENLGYQMDNLVPMTSVAYDDMDNVLYFSDTKFSIDELRELMRAFTEDDPDGNGIDDTHGAMYTDTWYDVYTSYGMFGFDQDGNHFYRDPVTGDYVPYYAYTKYKENLQYVTEMLEKGYYVRNPNLEPYLNELKATWATGKTGYMCMLSASRILGYTDMYEWPPASVCQKDPDAKFVVTPVPGEDGKFRPYWTFNWSEGYTYPIGYNCDDAKLARLFQILEYAYFGENWLRYKWGIEGIHYKWTGEPFASPIVMTPAEQIPPQYAGKNQIGVGHFGNINFVSDNKVYFSFDAFNNQFIDYWNIYNPGGYKSDNLWIRPDKYYSAFTMPDELFDEFKTLRDETSSSINTVHSDFRRKAFAGQISNFDAEWTQYIEQIYAAGLQQWVDIWNRDEVKTYDYFASLSPSQGK
jgi:putative aldouronate transport system substrate-binding protein